MLLVYKLLAYIGTVRVSQVPNQTPRLRKHTNTEDHEEAGFATQYLE